MEIKRTANAGILLKLDGVKILMDGVCNAEYPYLGTPDQLRTALLQDAPDALLITHRHEDHYDATFVSDYLQKAAGPVLGPADIPFCDVQTAAAGNVRITPIPSRHIGKTEPMGHVSFVLQGTKCVWFTGDASPLQWKNREDLPKPDVLIAPYAYAIGSGWEITKALMPQTVILLHLPEKDADPYRLWQAVEDTTGQGNGPKLYLPAVGQSVAFAE